MCKIKICENEIYQGDCLDLLDSLPDDSIDLILTDPPYFLDKLDNEWTRSEVDSKKYQKHGTVTSLPAGMAFDPDQSKLLYEFYLEVSKKAMRVLKPGAYFFSFSAPRLYHNIASAVDDAGFYIRDQFMWLYLRNQPKAQGMSNFIKKAKWLSEDDKKKYVKEFEGWKTPQVRSNHEPICLAQKPPEGTFLQNQIKHGVGLINCNVKVSKNKHVSNCLTSESIRLELDSHFLVDKPSRKEKRPYNDHKTVKPIRILSHLISLTTLPEALVLDPFAGSGSTCVAAYLLNRKYIGFELDEHNVEISKKRLYELSYDIWDDM